MLTLKKQHSKNDQFFSVPSFLASYWAGFIAADGYVVNYPPKLGIELARTDKDHLARFKNDTLYSGDIFDRTRGSIELCRLQIPSCLQWLKDLKQWYNITPRKSLTLKAPRQLTLYQQKAFLVGLFDGDGCVSFDHKGEWTGLRLTLATGSEDIAQWVKQWFIRLGQKEKRYIYKTRRTFSVIATGAVAERIAGSLVTVPVPKLARKWGRFTKYIKDLDSYVDTEEAA